MKARGSWFVGACLAVSACATTLGCDGFLGSSKMAHGERYQSDDARYDPYFDGVHQQQVAAAAWADEKKVARRSLVGVLSLTPSSSDDTIVSATRERAKKLGGTAKLDLASAHVAAGGGANDPPLFAAIEELVRLELERARKLKAASEKLEEMAKQGEDLRKIADREFENRGADKADEKKNEKRSEVRRELGGAVDASRSLARDATRFAKEAQEFLEDLGNALEANETSTRGRGTRESKPLPPPPPKAEEPKKEEPKKEEAKPGKPGGKPADTAKKPKPADKPADKPPAEKPAPKPAPPPEEEFTP